MNSFKLPEGTLFQWPNSEARDDPWGALVENRQWFGIILFNLQNVEFINIASVIGPHGGICVQSASSLVSAYTLITRTNHEVNMCEQRWENGGHVPG